MINRVTPGSFSASMRTSNKFTPTDDVAVRHEADTGKGTGSAIYDNFGFSNFTPEDLTSDGKVPIIIAGKSKRSLKRLKGKLAKKFDIDQVKFKEDLPLVDGIKMEIDPYNFRQVMKALPKGTQVVLDSKIKYPKPEQLKPKIPGPEKESRPALDIANSTLGINRLWEMGYTGKGVGICVIDSGLHPHKDFEGRIKAFVDIHDGKETPHDPYGHGTHVTSVAAGSGAESAGKYKGVAPDADIVAIRITSVSEAIKGIQWAIENKDKFNIDVINMSLGDFPIKSYKTDPWAQAAEKAWDAGMLVVVAAGNEGPGEGTISTPGIAPKVITVGAIDDQNTPERGDDEIAEFSSRGPTSPDGLTKPDIVAPGVEIFGALSPESTLDTPDLPHVGKKYIGISGSSMATPLVSGLGALLIQANPDLSNEDIKRILMDTAENYIPGAKPEDQGVGLIDPIEALQVALLRKDPKNLPMVIKKENNLPMLIADNVIDKKSNK